MPRVHFTISMYLDQFLLVLLVVVALLVLGTLYARHWLSRRVDRL